MSVILRTPPLHRAGRYTLRAPWAADDSIVFSCMALRSFSDCEKLGVDVYKTYYQPMGLSTTVYNNDKAANAHIVTLMSETSVIYVPDSYIESYPSMTEYTYQNVVLSISLGAVPDYIDTTFLNQQLATVVSDVIGIMPTVNVHVSPSTGTVSADQHEIAEAARAAAIKTRQTDYAKLLIAQGTITTLQTKVTALTKLCTDNSLL